MNSDKRYEITSKDGIVKEIEHFASSLARSSKFINYLIVVGAMLAGTAQFINNNELIRALGILGVFIVFSGSLVTAIVNQTPPRILADAFIDAQKAELIDLYEEDLIRWNLLYITQDIIREHLEGNIPIDQKDISRHWTSILNLTARNLKQLMDFSGGEVWSISIFQADQNANGEFLKCIARIRTGGGVNLENARVWALGEGVVGQCYKIKRELVVQNIDNKDEISWMHVEPENFSENDIDFNSFAAIPVMFAEQAWGVVVAISNVKNKYLKNGHGEGDNSIEPLRMLAAMVALSVAKRRTDDSI